MTVDPVRIFCAGSLRTAVTGAVGRRAGLIFGPSGLLRQRVEAGERCDIFISADMDHPRTLAADGDFGPVEILAENQLCLLVRPGLEVDGRTVVDLMLDPGLNLGTSTPGANPGGDWAWRIFDLAGADNPDIAQRLKDKALPLVGGRNHRSDPDGEHPVVALLARGEADVFLGYHTTARLAVERLPGTRALDLPPGLTVRVLYGLTVRVGAGQAARHLAADLLTGPGGDVLARHGFR